MRFTEKSVLVTGAARGIGRAIAHRLWEEGANVVAADIDADALGADAPVAVDGRQWIAQRVDIADASSVSTLVAVATARLGTLHGLVNNAAMLDLSVTETLDFTRYRDVMAVNLDGALRMTLAALPLLKAARGSIVNVASIMGMAGLRNAVPYATAKAGLINMTRSLAVDFAASGIRVNALAPGFIATRMSRLPDGRSEYDTEQFRDVYLKHGKLPLGAPGSAEDVAGPAAFLLSDDANYVTGHVLVVDGGVTATY